MRAERPILLRFLNVLTSLNDFIIKRIVFLFLVKYIASGTLTLDPMGKMFQNASSLKPLGQLKPNCPGIIMWRSSR